MRASRFLILGFSVLFLATTAPATADEASDEQLAADVRDAIGRFQEKDSTLKASLEKLVGYAVFPEVAKGGFIVGGARGRGEVYAGGKLIGHAQISQGTIGAQIGGQKFAEIILFKTKSALNRFKKNRLELSAQATANVANQGAAAKAKYADGLVIFVLPTAGLMAEASIGGQKLKFAPLKD
ncbi:MAG: lipid-binding SYLF domain-containing protein [Myxococcales bacterium]|nr:lipid-binding SYLF domain-containing protein [Myxococcales bacterium]